MSACEIESDALVLEATRTRRMALLLKSKEMASQRSRRVISLTTTRCVIGIIIIFNRLTIDEGTSPQRT